MTKKQASNVAIWIFLIGYSCVLIPAFYFWGIGGIILTFGILCLFTLLMKKLKDIELTIEDLDL